MRFRDPHTESPVEKSVGSNPTPGPTMGSGFPWLDWQIRRAETGGQRFSFSFPCLGRIPLPPFPNNFHEGSFTFLGETVRFVHVLAGFFGQNWGLRGAFWSRAGLLAGARELSDGS